MAIGGERLAGHRRAQVRAADADVDHVADRFAGIAAPAPLAHRCGELADALAYRRHGRHHVLAIDLEARARRRAQRHMQHRAAFGIVDRHAGEHLVAGGLEPALTRQRKQQLERPGVDAVLRIVEGQARGGEREALEAARLFAEQGAKPGIAEGRRMGGQGLPGRGLAGRVLGARGSHACLVQKRN